MGVRRVRKPEYIFTPHGTLWLCEPTTAAARRHLQSHVSTEAQWHGGALAVEPCYVDGLMAALSEDGYRVVTRF